MPNLGSNSIPWNQKTVKKDLLDKKHGMQSNQKSMKPKLLKELLKMKSLIDSKNTSVRNYQPPPNSSAKEIDLLKQINYEQQFFMHFIFSVINNIIKQILSNPYLKQQIKQLIIKGQLMVGRQLNKNKNQNISKISLKFIYS
ncbi:unnamed protein product (macronuclear) [Paramecium tetraurelia]|uniref:Transmembrane protein n=1 Tax=Paramecium tetraurelia TaxID=5888 RepID=A0DAB3_PARTE|nr:uncharacterized protein GSPATT00014887001 [Paramecium tetraurelia]CAK79980.1 unnamed protein product [Paramecium tetraurelia]|eukprot:XP_001447377.1 hypothetical protein (macronuclear) [Paramecium tetraurelia strain d4-2]